MNEQLERNKQTVTEFYDLMFNQCKPREAMDTHAGRGIHPTQSARCGRKEAFIA